MSHWSTLEFEVEFLQKLSLQEVVKSLLNFSWGFYDSEGFVRFLPVHDGDNHNWQKKRLSLEEVYELLKNQEKEDKETKNDMFWHGTDIGVTCRLKYDLFEFSLSINRQINSKCFNFTDCNWYLERIMPALQIKGLHISAVTWRESR